MNVPRSLVKVAVVASSVLLVGGFVAYRAGAVNWLMGDSARPADSEIIMKSSKSGSVVEFPATDTPEAPPSNATEPPPADNTQSAQVIMPSSKVIIITPLPGKPSTQPSSPSQRSAGSR